MNLLYDVNRYIRRVGTSPGSQTVVLLQCSGRSTLLQEEHSTETQRIRLINCYNNFSNLLFTFLVINNTKAKN